VTFDTFKVGKKLELAFSNPKKIDIPAPNFYIRGSSLPDLVAL